MCVNKTKSPNAWIDSLTEAVSVVSRNTRATPVQHPWRITRLNTAVNFASRSAQIENRASTRATTRATTRAIERAFQCVLAAFPCILDFRFSQEKTL